MCGFNTETPYIYIYIHTYTHIYIYIYIEWYVCFYIYIHIYIYICVCVCVCMCVCSTWEILYRFKIQTTKKTNPDTLMVTFYIINLCSNVPHELGNRERLHLRLNKIFSSDGIELILKNNSLKLHKVDFSKAFESIRRRKITKTDYIRFYFIT